MSTARTAARDLPKPRPVPGWIAIVPVLISVALLVALWRAGVFARFDSPERLAEALRALGGTPLGFVYTMLAFVLGTLVFMPITVLIGGTLLAFGATRGFAFSLLGVQLAAMVTYACGRALGARVLDRVSGPRVARFRAALGRNAFLASAAARIVPVGNFTLINALIGSMRVPFFAFFCGNILGTAPGLFVFAALARLL